VIIGRFFLRGNLAPCGAATVDQRFETCLVSPFDQRGMINAIFPQIIKPVRDMVCIQPPAGPFHGGAIRYTVEDSQLDIS